MQVPGAIDFGRHHSLESFLRLHHQHAVIQHAGQMEDPPQRRHGLLDLRQSGRQTLRVGGIAVQHSDFRAQASHPGNFRRGLGLGRAAAQQGQMARAPLD